jgi:hypothetical protein
MLRVAVGVDDTDNLESRGTGYRARELGLHLQQRGLGRLLSVTRHQLLVSPEIRYTSHNSSACLVLDVSAQGVDDLQVACQTYLRAESAPGSDVGLCVAAWDRLERAGAVLTDFGERAKREVLTRREAENLAAATGLFLAGLTGDQGGVIGALAGLGLRFGGNDGRFLWLPGLRELSGDRHTPGQLKGEAGLEAVATLEGSPVGEDSFISTGEWVRPVLRGGKAVLLVEPKGARSGGGREPDWQLVDKETVKRLSS